MSEPIKFPSLGRKKSTAKRRLMDIKRKGVTSINVKDPWRLALKITNNRLIARYEPDHYVSEIQIEICYFDEHFGKEENIGGGFCFFIDNGLALDEGVNTLDVMDDHSHKLLKLYEALFDHETDELRRDELVDDVFNDNILFVPYIYLYPEYRGFGWGLACLLGIIDEVGKGAGLIVIEALPIEFENEKLNERLGLRSLSKEEVKDAKKSLAEYFSLIGFKPIPRNNDWLFYSNAIPRPSVEKLFEQIENKKVPYVKS